MLENIDPTRNPQDVKQSQDLFVQDLLRPKVLPYILVVNLHDPNNISLKIVSGQALDAHVERYGHAYYLYLGLLPKRNDLNINIFREYFDSRIGQQIIQMILSGGNTKLKGKLKSLLIPATFTYADVPASADPNLDILNSNTEQIIQKHVDQLMNSFSMARERIRVQAQRYPWFTLGQLAYFSASLKDAHFKLGHDKKDGRKIIFENPMICNVLISLKTRPIYPYHDDVFIEISAAQKNDVHAPLMGVRMNQIDNGQYALSLLGDAGETARLHADKLMLEFLEYILQKAVGLPISKILASLQVPGFEEMKQSVARHDLYIQALSSIVDEVKQCINQIFTDQITKN